MRPLPEVEWVPVSSLVPDPQNVARHSKRNRDSLRAALQRWGQLVPLVIDDDNVVRKGNLTHSLLSELGVENAMVIRGDFADDVDAVAFGVADNRISQLGSVDRDRLRQALEVATRIEGIEIAALGYAESEIEKILAVDLELDAPGLPDDGVGADSVVAADPLQRTRMLQLFYSSADHSAVVENLEKLRLSWSCDTLSEVVRLLVLRLAKEV